MNKDYNELTPEDFDLVLKSHGCMKASTPDDRKGGLGCPCCNTTRPRKGAGSRKARRKGAKQITRATRHKFKKAAADEASGP